MQLFSGGGRSSGAAASPTLSSVLSSLTLTTNLKACLDTRLGAVNYPSNTVQRPVVQTESDESWSEIIGPKTQPAWANAIHQNSAQFTIVTFFYYTATAAIQTLVGDNADGNTGFEFIVRSTDKPQLYVTNAGSDVLVNKIGDTSVAAGWNMLAVSVDETSGTGGVFYMNGAINQVSASDTWDPTYSSPAAGAATYVIQVGAGGNNSLAMAANSPLACAAIWQGTVLTTTELGSIWTSMRGRFGL